MMNREGDKGMEKNTAAAGDGAVSSVEKKDGKKEKKEKRKMEPRKKKRIIRWTIILVVVAAIIAFSIFNNAKAASAGVMVQTTKAFTGDVESTISTSGFVNSEEIKTYYAPVDVKVQDMTVEAGDIVSAGQKLMNFDTEALERATREAELTVAENENEYQEALKKSAEEESDFAASSVNVETYKAMIVAQRAYINDLNQAVAQRTSDAECIAEGGKKKQSEIADKIAEKTEELNKLLGASGNTAGTAGTTGGITVSGNTVEEKKIVDLRNEIARLERDSAKLGTSSIPSGATPEEARRITEAQTLLSDMESYMGDDKGIKKAAEEGILDQYQKAKLKATREKTKLKAEEAKDNLAKASEGVTSEFNGIVTEISVENGAAAAAGTKLIKVENSDNVKVVISVSKYDLEKIALGQKADIDIAGNPYKGSITKINRMAHKNDSGAMVVGAEIHVDNPDENIYLGVEAKVVIHLKEAKNVVLVPVETINTDSSGEFCYAVENGVIVKKPVKTGIASDTYTEIVEGLKSGDSIITQVTPNIQEGMPATEMPDQTMQAAQQDGAAGAAAEDASTDETEDAEQEDSQE